MNGQFDPNRLTLARRLACLTKRQLADRIGVTAPAISQFELGRTTPRPAVLAQIGLVLGSPTSYFFTEEGRRSPEISSRAFFRSLRSTRQWERDYAEALVEHLADVVALLEQDFELPSLELPDCSWIDATSRGAEIDKAAAAVRDEWNLPRGPVGNVVLELEAHGVLVARLGDEALRVDAFSRWLDDRPLVVLWASKGDKARSRFDASHELGHLVMHPDPEPANPLFEKQAHRFASAFLMPANDIEEELPRRPPRIQDWDSLFATRRRWGVSIAALIRRARDLGTLPDAGFRRSMMRLSERGMRRDEGDDLGPPEQPEFLGRALFALAEARNQEIEHLADSLHFAASHLLSLVPADGPQTDLKPRAGTRPLRAVQDL